MTDLQIKANLYTQKALEADEAARNAKRPADAKFERNLADSYGMKARQYSAAAIAAHKRQTATW